MSVIKSTRDSASILFVLLAIQLRILKYIGFSIIHVLLETDDDARSALPFSASLPKGIHADNGLAGDTFRHSFVAPGPHDSRSPCPALNAMANHGYLPRDGRRLTGTVLTRALMGCYNLSWPLATFLSWGGVVLLGQVGSLSLHDFARHNRVEHDASIVHENTGSADAYAPIHPDMLLLNDFLHDSRYGTYTVEDIARARVRREAEPGMKLTGVQQEIGRGEFALVLHIFGGERLMVSKDLMLKWMKEERLPNGWVPEEQTTLLGTIGVASKIRNAMTALRTRLGRTMEKAEKANGAGGSVEKRSIEGLPRTYSFDSDGELEQAYVSIERKAPRSKHRQ